MIKGKHLNLDWD